MPYRNSLRAESPSDMNRRLGGRASNRKRSNTDHRHQRSPLELYGNHHHVVDMQQMGGCFEDTFESGRYGRGERYGMKRRRRSDPFGNSECRFAYTRRRESDQSYRVDRDDRVDSYTSPNGWSKTCPVRRRNGPELGAIGSNKNGVQSRTNRRRNGLYPCPYSRNDDASEDFTVRRQNHRRDDGSKTGPIRIQNLPYTVPQRREESAKMGPTRTRNVPYKVPQRRNEGLKMDPTRVQNIPYRVPQRRDNESRTGPMRMQNLHYTVPQRREEGSKMGPTRTRNAPYTVPQRRDNGSKTGPMRMQNLPYAVPQRSDEGQKTGPIRRHNLTYTVLQRRDDGTKTGAIQRLDKSHLAIQGIDNRSNAARFFERDGGHFSNMSGPINTNQTSSTLRRTGTSTQLRLGPNKNRIMSATRNAQDGLQRERFARTSGGGRIQHMSSSAVKTTIARRVRRIALARIQNHNGKLNPNRLRARVTGLKDETQRKFRTLFIPESFRGRIVGSPATKIHFVGPRPHPERRFAD